MARKAALLVLMLVLVTVYEGVSAQNVLCNITYQGLKSCKPAVNKANPKPPTKECCEAIKGADLVCLCKYKNNPLLPSYEIDPTLALALPAKCNRSLPRNC